VPTTNLISQLDKVDYAES